MRHRARRRPDGRRLALHPRDDRQRPDRSGRTPRHPSLQGHGADARQRPQGDRGPHRVPEPRLRPDPGADGLAQRGGAGQVGLRPLLRAHDVPRHRQLPAREVPGDHDPRRGADRTPTPPTTTRTTTPPSPRRTWRRSSRSRPTGSRTSRTRRRRSRPRPAPCSGSTTRTAPTPSTSSSRCSATTPSRAHPYKHTTMGFLRDIEDMPNQFQYAQEFFRRWYRPEYTTVIVAGDVTPEEVLPLVEKHWGDWKPGTYKVDIPQEPLPRGPVHAHVPWPTATLPWVAVAFHAPAFSETEKEYASLDLLMDLTFGPTSDLYKRLVEDEQKVDQLFPYYPGNADPYLATAAARVKDMKDAAGRAQPDPQGLRGGAGEAHPRRPARGREVERALRLRAHARQHRVDRGRPGALREVPPRLRDPERAVPRLRVGHARGHPGRRAEVLHGRGPGGHHAVEGADAGGHGHAAGAREPGLARAEAPPSTDAGSHGRATAAREPGRAGRGRRRRGIGHARWTSPARCRSSTSSCSSPSARPTTRRARRAWPP